MDLRVQNDVVVGLPEFFETFFLARVEAFCLPCFVAVVGKKIPGLPPQITKVVIFNEAGFPIVFHSVLRGRTNPWGGGSAEITGDGKGIAWTTTDECGRNEFLGVRIKLEDVIIAL